MNLENLTQKQRKGLQARLEAEESEDLTIQEAAEKRGVSKATAYRTVKKYPEAYEELKQRRANDGLTNGEESGSVSVELPEEPEPFRDSDASVSLPEERVLEAVERYVEAEMFAVEVEVDGTEYRDGSLYVGVSFE